MILGEWWRRFRNLVGRDRATADLEDEMRLHLELRARAVQQRGEMDEADAAATAHRRFGNQLIQQEASRDMWGFRLIDAIGQDLRYAVRRLRQRPGFTFAVVGVLALGIGATTAMFSAVDAAMLRPLPFQHPEQLVTLPYINVPFDPGPGQPGLTKPWGIPDLSDVAKMPDAFSHVAAFASGGLNLSDPDHPQRVNVGVVTADFFTTLGATAAIGHLFPSEAGRPGGPAMAILSYGLWQRQFGGREMIDRTVMLNGKSYTVVGVMPRGFSFPDQSDLWIPMTVPVTFATFEPFRGFLPSTAIARAAPGLSVREAARRLAVRWEQGFAAYQADTARRSPAMETERDYIRNRGATISLQQNLVGDRRTALLVLLGATGLLLLIACANVTNLLLSQAVMRRREIAVREVLGATRRRVIRQLLTESVLLALGGTLLGLALAPAALRLVRALLPAELAGVAPAQVDLRVLVFAALLALLTGIGFGLWPAVGTTSGALGETIKAGAGPGITPRGSGRIRRGLLMAELSLTVMLLIGAGLMLRSFRQLMAADRGMNAERVGTLELAFPRTGRPQAARLQFLNTVLARLQATPGIIAAGVVNDLPLGGGGGISLTISIDGAPEPKSDDRPGARYLIASGGYFAALGIPLIAGRTFASTDDSLGPAVAVISAGMAKADWPGVSAVGKTFHLSRGDATPITVIGVVQDVREFKLEEEALPQMYLSVYRETPSHHALVARSNLSSAALLAAMQSAVRTVDPSQAVFHVRMMDDVVSMSVAPRRTNTLLIALFALLALVLASLGVYAVVAHSVAQRTREFGIRTALGASGHDLIALVSREMLWVAVAGLGAGLAGAWMLARIVTSLLYRVDMHDPATFAVVPLVLLIPVIAATALPARRASVVNPADVMRAE